MINNKLLARIVDFTFTKENEEKNEINFRLAKTLRGKFS